MTQEYLRAIAGSGLGDGVTTFGRIGLAGNLILIRLHGADGPIQIAHDHRGTPRTEGEVLLVAPTQEAPGPGRVPALIGYRVVERAICPPSKIGQYWVTTAFYDNGGWEWRDSAGATIVTPMVGQVNGFNSDTIDIADTPADARLLSWHPYRFAFDSTDGQAYILDRRQGNGGYCAHDYMYRWNPATNEAVRWWGRRMPGGIVNTNSFAGPQNVTPNEWMFGRLTPTAITVGGPDRMVAVGAGDGVGSIVGVIYLNDAILRMELIAGSYYPLNYAAVGMPGSPLEFEIDPVFPPPGYSLPNPYPARGQSITWPDSSLRPLAIDPSSGQLYIGSGVTNGQFEILRVELNSDGRIGFVNDYDNYSIMQAVVRCAPGFDINNLPPPTAGFESSNPGHAMAFSPDGILYFLYDFKVWTYTPATGVITHIIGNATNVAYPGGGAPYFPTDDCFDPFLYTFFFADLCVGPDGTLYLLHAPGTVGMILAYTGDRLSVVARPASPASANSDYTPIVAGPEPGNDGISYPTWPRAATIEALLINTTIGTQIQAHPITGKLYAITQNASIDPANAVPPAFSSGVPVGNPIVSTSDHITRFEP